MAEGQWLKTVDGLDIKPCEFKPDLDDKTKFIKLENGSAAKMQISAFMQQMPALVGIAASENLYVATFPQGVPHVLSELNSGGYFTAIRDPETGRFIGQAALNPVSNYAVVATAFTVMSVATSQYYLTEINSKLNKIRLCVDEILKFLYGDKRAELMSEVMFAQYAYENYISIMAHDKQCLATISGLQDAKKVAMKDLEFYIADLDNVCANLGKDIPQTAKNALRLKDCLDLSAQLYALSGIMEMYYSQNTDENYISYVEREMDGYIDKSEKHILQDFAKIINPVLTCKSKELSDKEKQRMKTIMEELSEGGESSLRKSLKEALHSPERSAEYYIKTNGDVYMRA